MDRGTEGDRYIESQTTIQTHRKTDTQTDTQTDRQRDIQTDRQTDRQTDSQTDRHRQAAYRHRHLNKILLRRLKSPGSND